MFIQNHMIHSSDVRSLKNREIPQLIHLRNNKNTLFTIRNVSRSVDFHRQCYKLSMNCLAFHNLQRNRFGLHCRLQTVRFHQSLHLDGRCC